MKKKKITAIMAVISDVHWCFKRRVHEMLNEDEEEESEGIER